MKLGILVASIGTVLYIIGTAGYFIVSLTLMLCLSLLTLIFGVLEGLSYIISDWAYNRLMALKEINHNVLNPDSKKDRI